MITRLFVCLFFKPLENVIMLESVNSRVYNELTAEAPLRTVKVLSSEKDLNF